MSDLPVPSTEPMWLVYVDAASQYTYQPWREVVEVGTPICEVSGEEMELVGWTTEDPGEEQ